MFHSTLEKESEISTSFKNETYRIAKINTDKDLYISNKSIDVNGKLDSTAVIRDVEPMLDDILSKLVISNSGLFITSSILEGKPDSELTEIFNKNTGAYLNGVMRQEDKTDIIYNEIINNLTEESKKDVEILTKIRNYVNNNPTLTPLNALIGAFSNDNLYYVIADNGKWKVGKFPVDAKKVYTN